MNKTIFLSIKPIYIEKIISKTKNYEFRNYIPKKEFDTIFVYVSYPICQLSYIISVNNIIKYPQEIEVNGDGNLEFNNGKSTKYAYEISKIKKLITPIPLNKLREDYNFTPPQGFSYGESYQDLFKVVINSKKELI